MFAAAVLALGCAPKGTGSQSPETIPPLATSSDARSDATPRDGASPSTGDEQAPSALATGQRPPPLTEDQRLRRERAVAALDEGRYSEARDLLESLVEERPDQPSLTALLSAARQGEDDLRSGVTARLALQRPVVLDEPPWTHVVRREVAMPDRSGPLRLQLVSQERNDIIDDQAWFTQHGFEIPAWEVPNPPMQQEGNLPTYIPPRHGNDRIIAAIRHPDHAIAIYGPDFASGYKLAVLDPRGHTLAFFDFTRFGKAPPDPAADEDLADYADQTIGWAEVRDGTLFVATGHNTYASASAGKNAYLNAIDVRTGELLWRSPPLVCNMVNFVFVHGWIVTGYGFTREPDYLVVLDPRTGDIADKTKLKTGPSWAFTRDDHLYVRTYDTNYEFRVHVQSP